MRLTFSIEDDLAGAIDTAAAALGTTRSGWIAHAIRKQVGAIDGSVDREGRGRSRRKRGEAQVHFRMSAEELAQVDRAARRIGLTRTQFFVASARGRVWRDQDVIAHTPDTKDEMREAIRQLRAIGVNLNQAVRTLRGAVTADAGLQLEVAMKLLAEQAEQVDQQVVATMRAITAQLSVEQDAWRWR